MISREEALKFLEEKIANKNIIKHLLATEALMAGIFDFLANKGITDLGGAKEEWIMAGLLHDGDYAPEVPENLQGVKVSQWLEERKFEVPENVKHTMAAHNSATGIIPKSKMDWSLFAADSLTGLIVATALVRPDKKLSSVVVDSVLKKFKDPAFARGTRREDIKIGAEKLGMTLEEFILISLAAMQKIAQDLGL